MRITRHFIDVRKNGQSRRVHYRRAGNGPPLLMVHQSPRSSKEYETLIEKWAENFTCIAPDTAGFGQSDALPGQPEINDFADSVIDLLDALGIGKCAAYGFHSGGIILVTAAKRQANRFTCLAVGGYAVWSPEEMALFSDRYLPEFHPAAYGEHLAWLWNRILEQSWFFPWFATDDAHRLPVSNDRPERVDAIVREMLDAGNAYQAGYGAVLRAPRDIPAPGTEVPPCLITAYDGDPLQDHIDRLGELPSNWNAQKVRTPEDLENSCLAFLQQHETPLSDRILEAGNEGFISVETEQFDGLVHWRGEQGSETLVLHGPGYAMATEPDPGCIAIDLPGHGLSDAWDGDPPDNWGDWRVVIDAVAANLGTTDVRYPDLPACDPDRLYPDLSPDRFGNYLHMAWQIVRARHMFAPWYEVDPAHEKAFDADDLDPENLAREHLALIQASAAKHYHLALQSR
ncbi:Pimeloyl-ACP methyl ester carboxylesterase [Parasphingorhabdus marina DSM 22363]|uniref:Pimeloyl-ACP methyl ester carboxylesterase n=1 Tax=Parasphingorhabdus marina DSM 22363 TaxID=1123272 RepID=A0A1N6CMI8_9SPHN|nr:alpha/beta fold hydrolase [Parasphingorhabdus marina]SIN59781.1 Pimeloyl-ACP methyl ester carboxylesterase [Parasphingorhabdus marina DSM 22363]